MEALTIIKEFFTPGTKAVNQALTPPPGWNGAQTKQTDTSGLGNGVHYTRDGKPYTVTVEKAEEQGPVIETWNFINDTDAKKGTPELTDQDKQALAKKKINSQKAVLLKRLYHAGTTASTAAKSLGISSSLAEKVFSAFSLAQNCKMQ